MNSTRPMVFTLALILMLPVDGQAEPETVQQHLGHHGGLVTQCTDPQFFDETPGQEARAKSLETIRFTASANTVPETIKLQVNLQPQVTTITRQRSQHVLVEAKLPAPITQGRAWIKVTAKSDDGCDQIHTWNVHTGE